MLIRHAAPFISPNNTNAELDFKLPPTYLQYVRSLLPQTPAQRQRSTIPKLQNPLQAPRKSALLNETKLRKNATATQDSAAHALSMVSTLEACQFLGFRVADFKNHAYQICCTRHLGGSRLDKHGFHSEGVSAPGG